MRVSAVIVRDNPEEWLQVMQEAIGTEKGDLKRNGVVVGKLVETYIENKQVVCVYEVEDDYAYLFFPDKIKVSSRDM